MGATARHRFNPRTGLYTYGTITNETHTVALIDELGLYGFYLDEAPRIIRTVGSSLTVVQDITGGATWTEQRPGPPDAGSYWLDWRYDTAFVEFNSADNGKNFLVSYSGKGGLASIDNFPTVVEALITSFPSLSVTGDLSVGNDLSVTGDSLFSGGFRTEGSDNFKFKRLQIGAWDMDTTASVTVAHGISGFTETNFLFGFAIIIRDDSASFSNLGNIVASSGLVAGAVSGVTPTTVGLTRSDGGLFDNTNYNDAVMNRGFLFIGYRA